jgi:predicted unusual protein kinase regulating ubiquinone biosynthesis (AarF/ABC1/UbiB family)
MGEPTEEFEERAFRRRITALVTGYRTTPGEEVAAGRVFMSLARTAAETGLRVDPVFAMLGRTLMSLERVGRTLDPTFDPNEALRREAAAVLQRRLMQSAAPSNLLSSALEMNDFLQRLPARLNHVLDAVERGPELRLQLLEQTRLIQGLQKIANRITLGLLLAALIIGAAMLMRVETPFRVFGYPGFAMIAFLLAAGGAVALAWSILSKDE